MPDVSVLVGVLSGVAWGTTGTTGLVWFDTGFTLMVSPLPDRTLGSERASLAPKKLMRPKKPRTGTAVAMGCWFELSAEAATATATGPKDDSAIDCCVERRMDSRDEARMDSRFDSCNDSRFDSRNDSRAECCGDSPCTPGKPW
jgi:hypothetical protein